MRIFAAFLIWPLVEIAFGCFFTWVFGYCVAIGNFGVLPFLLLFVVYGLTRGDWIVGALAGINYGTITNCASSTAVQSLGGGFVGGMLGDHPDLAAEDDALEAMVEGGSKALGMLQPVGEEAGGEAMMGLVLQFDGLLQRGHPAGNHGQRQQEPCAGHPYTKRP